MMITSQLVVINIIVSMVIIINLDNWGYRYYIYVMQWNRITQTNTPLPPSASKQIYETMS